MIIGSRQRSSARCDVEIRVGRSCCELKCITKSLGLTIDAQLSWGKHIEEICKKVSSAIGALKRVRPFISKGTAIQIYKRSNYVPFRSLQPRLGLSELLLE